MQGRWIDGEGELTGWIVTSQEPPRLVVRASQVNEYEARIVKLRSNWWEEISQPEAKFNAERGIYWRYYCHFCRQTGPWPEGVKHASNCIIKPELFEVYNEKTGKVHCEYCGAIYPTVRHTSNCLRAAEDKREWPNDA